MRDNRLLHTPQKDRHQIANRPTKFISEQPAKPQKVNRKCLSSVFAPASEVVPSESSEDAIDISSITEVSSDDSQFCDSKENSYTSSNPVVSSAVASSASDQTPISSAITSEFSSLSSMITSPPPLSFAITSNKAQPPDVSLECGTAKSKVAMRRGSIVTELTAKRFRQAGIEPSSSNDMVLLSRNVFDALLKVGIEGCYDFLEEGSWLAETVEKRVFRVLRKAFGIFLFIVLLILICAGFFYFSGQWTIYELPPT